MSCQPPTWWPQQTVQCYRDLVSYQLVGASACADRISSALTTLAARAEQERRDLADVLDEAGRAFCALKPDTALYVNVIDLISRAGRHDRAADVLDRAVWLSAYRRAAQAQVVAQTVDELDQAEVILVHDYSSTVLSILEQLAGRRSRRIIVTAGEPLGQGRRVAHMVASFGHQIIYVPDMSVARVIADADAFVTGVESFYDDGSLANTVGTMMLCLLCRERDVPVIAPAECLKYDRNQATVRTEHLTARLLTPWPPDEPARRSSWTIEDHVLDAVPGSLISSYVTETGVCSAGDVGRTARTAWAGLQDNPAPFAAGATSDAGDRNETRQTCRRL